MLKKLYKKVIGKKANRKHVVEVSDPIAECAFVATRRHGHGGDGKCSKEHYLPEMQQALALRGVSSVRYRDYDAFLAETHSDRPTFAVLIYNERAENYAPRELEQIYESVEGSLSRLPSNVHIVNAPEIGRIVADKSATNRFLTAHGIRMPALAREGATFEVFSNTNDGSGDEVFTASGGAGLDAARYNTEFIDTRQEFRGREYYMTVRAMAVGGQLVTAFVRAGEVGQTLSVHSADTPLDPDLLIELHQRLVLANVPEIERICRAIADNLGPGFYAHDLLVCREHGNIYLCETNFKFDNRTYRNHIAPIASQLSALGTAATLDIAELSADCLIAEARHLGWLPDQVKAAS